MFEWLIKVLASAVVHTSTSESNVNDYVFNIFIPKANKVDKNNKFLSNLLFINT
jgi:hypothetical protein